VGRKLGDGLPTHRTPNAARWEVAYSVVVEPEVAVGDHAGRLLQRRLGLLDQETRSFGRSADLRAARVQSQRGDL
jgi:hypothetical protein